MKLYIEDLICKLGNTGQYLFTPPLSLWLMDEKVVSSLAVYPTMGKGYTVKQRALVLRLCQKYKTQLIDALGPEVEDLINNPEFKFTVVEPSVQERSVTIVNKEILVKFPYNESLVDSIRKYRDRSGQKLCEWSSDEKCWKFVLDEANVLWLKNNLITPSFSVDPEFYEIFEKISEILEKIEDHMPMVSYHDNQFLFKNTHRSVPQPDSDDLIKTLLVAKYYGISTWDENVENLIKNSNFSPILMSFLQESKPNDLEFDINDNPVDQLTDLFKYNLPALIVVPGYNEFFTLKFWSQWLKSQGIADKDISVLFRLPSGSGTLLNDFIKQENLNNPVDQNTKIVFVSQKIPKPLIKAGIDFKLILNLGSLSGVHYSISTFLENRPDIIRYTDKNKIGYQFGLL
jgi:hypothetical protein